MTWMPLEIARKSWQKSRNGLVPRLRKFRELEFGNSTFVQDFFQKRNSIWWWRNSIGARIVPKTAEGIREHNFSIYINSEFSRNFLRRGTKPFLDFCQLFLAISSGIPSHPMCNLTDEILGFCHELRQCQTVWWVTKSSLYVCLCTKRLPASFWGVWEC